MIKNPYPLVFEDHDGSWTWSIEIGEPFDDDHRVIDRDEGYETRRDAQRAVEKAMPLAREKLKKEAQKELDRREENLNQSAPTTGKDEAAETAPTQPPPVPEVPVKGKPEESDDTHEATDQQALTWGIYQRGKLIALFRTNKQAQEFARLDGARKVVRLALRWTPLN